MTLDEFRQQTKLLPGSTELRLKSPRDAHDKPILDTSWLPQENRLVLEGGRDK